MTNRVEELVEERLDGMEPSEDGDQARENLHETLLVKLRDFIVEGPLKPGARIPERELCERFSVSRTPLREALKVLASEELIELLANRGARVRSFTAKDIMDVFEVLAGLESVAGRLACERISDEEIARIEALHYDMYASYLRGNLPGYFHENQLIHEAIVASSRNKMLLATYRRTTSRVRQLRYRANADVPDRWSHAMREHEVMLQALQRRQGEELSTVLFNHVINKARAICAAVDAL